MEKIFRHIETLLRRHDYVIVPELGGFVYQHQSAVVSAESIEPPHITVSFNPLMNVSDGLLAIEFSRAEGVSFREASAAISKAVDQAKLSLKRKSELQIGHLGALSSDDEGKMIFVPSGNHHLIPANYGLSALHYTAAARHEERRVVSFKLPTAKVLTRYAAVGAIAVGLFFAAPKLSDATKNLANLFPIEQWNKADEQPEAVKPLEIAIPHAAILQQEASVTPTEQNASLKHHVIVSCMATQQDADQLCSHLKKMNFAGAHILPPIKTYRVAIQSFETKNDAVEFMSDLRQNNAQFADAWVLSEK